MAKANTNHRWSDADDVATLYATGLAIKDLPVPDLRLHKPLALARTVLGCGFETFHSSIRVPASLILQYRNALLGTSAKLRSRNWGAYIRELAGHGGDARVIGMLNHIKDFYRNPIMHPEETLTPDQALSLFHACLSAIVQLDAAIRALASPAAVAISPSRSVP